MKTRIHISLCALLFLVGAASAIAGSNADFEPHQLVCSVLPGGSIDDINATYGTSATPCRTV